jgi:glycine/D-amino acid oxidase-like deaminating enzyme
VFEPAAGYLRVEQCVLAHLAAAKSQGAELRYGITARGWRKDGSGICVETDQGDFVANKLVITAGPWAPQLLADLGVPLVIRRKHLYWFPNTDRKYHEAGGCPTYLYELTARREAGNGESRIQNDAEPTRKAGTPGDAFPRRAWERGQTLHGVYYGFPQIDELGVKVAEHSGGETITDPKSDPRPLDAADLARVEAFLTGYMPGVGRPMKRRSVCFYTMSPDEHFLVDRHPQNDNVFFTAGLSGHGFKFTSVLGEVMADFALRGKSDLPVGFLGLKRLVARP